VEAVGVVFAADETAMIILELHGMTSGMICAYCCVSDLSSYLDPGDFSLSYTHRAPTVNRIPLRGGCSSPFSPGIASRISPQTGFPFTPGEGESSTA
jgi:hypothetical protein